MRRSVHLRSPFPGRSCQRARAFTRECLQHASPLSTPPARLAYTSARLQDASTPQHASSTPRHDPSAAPCRPLRRSRAAPCKPFPGIFVRDARTVTTSCFSECSRPAQKPTNSSRMTPKKLKNTQTKSGRSRNSETWMTHSSSTSHIPRVSECRKAVQG